MAKLGALITATIFGLIGFALFHNEAAFWVLFCFSAFIGVPIGAIMDIVHRSREQREERADARMQYQSDVIAAAIKKGRPNVNIDARSVHVHENQPRRVNY